ncbi:hypothetical protein CGRA01v4_09293 [Colletotrichum graminicola]|nr:hypothetical protein CGRA01v4_09293 [Colletotrichum graminicola]
MNSPMTRLVGSSSSRSTTRTRTVRLAPGNPPSAVRDPRTARSTASASSPSSRSPRGPRLSCRSSTGRPSTRSPSRSPRDWSTRARPLRRLPCASSRRRLVTLGKRPRRRPSCSMTPAFATRTCA